MMFPTSLATSAGLRRTRVAAQVLGRPGRCCARAASVQAHGRGRAGIPRDQASAMVQSRRGDEGKQVADACAAVIAAEEKPCLLFFRRQFCATRPRNGLLSSRCLPSSRKRVSAAFWRMMLVDIDALRVPVAPACGYPHAVRHRGYGNLEGF